MMHLDTYSRFVKPVLVPMPERALFLADFVTIGDSFVQLIDTLTGYGLRVEDFMDTLITSIAMYGEKGVHETGMYVADAIMQDMFIDTVGSRLLRQIHVIGDQLITQLQWCGISLDQVRRENLRFYERRGFSTFVFVGDPNCELN